jgi:hypothetical protein
MNLYELQAKLESLRDKAALGYKAALARAATRFAALSAMLTAERAAHEATRRERDLYRAICVGLSRQLEARKTREASRPWWND